MKGVYRIRIDACPAWASVTEVSPELARVLGRASRSPAQMLKEDSDTMVGLFEASGRSWVVKRYALPLWKRTLYHAVRRTPAWREWNAARRLAGAGIRVASPVMLTLDTHGRWNQSLIVPYVDGQPLNHFLAAHKHDQALRLRVADQIGRQIGQMTSAGFVNRDHKAANLMVDAGCASGRHPPVIIDLAGLRAYRSRRRLFRMLARLLQTSDPTRITPRERLTCLRAALRADPSIVARPASRRAIVRGVRQVMAHL